MTAQQDTALIAGQLADLTQTVEELAKQLKGVRERADDAQARAAGPQCSGPARLSSRCG